MRPRTVQVENRGGDFTSGGTDATLTIRWPDTWTGWVRWVMRRETMRLTICAEMERLHPDDEVKQVSEALRLIHMLGLDLVTEGRLIEHRAGIRPC